MDDSSKQKAVPEKVVQLMVDDIFRKNGVKPEQVKKNISDEQKQMLKEMVDDLKTQVEQFSEKQKNTNQSSE
ncbi:spore coat protein W [Virgibacillus natechei]|uniref:Spore coat protein W n=1 Tax=Virgibacillus natechei TaxID=1216297 RepID=A0ABS4IBZ0_9BACI|nr:spore coat protein [Virgibacillus natechei]MBP1968461.1 spore coat protein W [Virgibacillus natechei]UZD13582.1 spore coat protein [Virgibacillus natechei]